MSLFAEDFVYCNKGHLGPDQLWSRMTPCAVKKYSVRGHLGPAYFTSISPNGHIGPDQLQSQVSSFAAEFVFFKGGHLGPDQLWS